MKHMYEENRKSLNAYVGCEHGCVYCVPSFQRQAKRQKNRCLKCYNYEPHFHPERLLKPPPKTVGDEFIFFPSSGDLAFAQPSELQAQIDYAEKYADRTFLMQSKAPKVFQAYKFPSNVILATTLETDKHLFFSRTGAYGIPSHAILYKSYEQISHAPIPEQRYVDFYDVQHKRKIVTVEPVLHFSPFLFASYIEMLGPEAVYVGYDNHNCKLPEPRLSQTLKLIEMLEKFTEVRRKTLRKAWWES